MMAEELEDKYERFFRYFDIDIKAIEEAATGGSLSDYYTKSQADAITNALDVRIDALETSGGAGDLTNYYTKGETNSLLANKQSINTELSALISLVPQNNDIIQRKTGAWSVRTPAQLKADMSLDNVNNTSDANKPVSTATQNALDALDARVDTLEGASGPDLSNYYTKSEVDSSLNGKQASDSDLTAIAALTPTNDDILQRKAGVWSNRTVAQFKTDLALVKSDVGLGNVDNTSDATKNSAVATLTNKDLTSGTNTFPTFNQSTTGNAATATALQTARTINGVSFNGTANITVADSTKVPTTRTVAGKALSSDVTLVKGDVGLGNVDNTSDALKPVSTATQTALNLKADVAATPRYLVFNTTWPARPADSRLTIYVGGSSASNAPTDSVSGDVWIPSS